MDFTDIVFAAPIVFVLAVVAGAIWGIVSIAAFIGGAR
jgi:hypothetical protein